MNNCNPLNNLAKILRNDFQDSLKNFNSRLDKINEMCGDLAKRISEDYQENINTIKIWAKYGWVFNDDIPIYKFLIIPNSQEDADNIVMKYVDEKLEKEFISFKNKIELPQATINEIQGCYENQNYIAVTMMTIGLIERKLLLNQPEKIKFKTGEKIFTYLKSSFDKKEDDGSFTWMTYISLLTFIYNLFEKANNFIDEPPYLNRNYIMHGLSNRIINKIDCIKLVYVLDLLLFIFEE